MKGLFAVAGPIFAGIDTEVRSLRLHWITRLNPRVVPASQVVNVLSARIDQHLRHTGA
jgi:hypothetical protein